VRDIAFSPDSLKLAVSQSDNIVFIYNLGSSWGDKKTICNKFEQTTQVTVLIWPLSKPNELYFGVAEGKVLNYS
jgi:intraflagellar transport protein 172